MVSLDASIIALLRDVRVELTCASAGDTLSLARPRARLAWIASLLPPGYDEPRRVLDMVAQVGAEIGLGRERGSRDTIRLKAAVQAVTAVMEHLLNPRSNESVRSMDEAERTLAAVSNRVRASAGPGSVYAPDMVQRAGAMPPVFGNVQAPPGDGSQR